ncbi:nucleotidyltransferase family protein [Polaribacter sp.]|uniref:nucleotidyltransferase family protein n=1 Tax=Polaribacter sp. TaxID=1920175 RepID=UPI004048D076
MNKIAVLVLAAGKSSRMHTPKQLLKIGNQSLLDIVLAKAIQVVSTPIYCVLGANAATIQQEIATKNVVYIFNENYQEGLSTSIVSGINYLEKNHPNLEGVFILLADQPAIEIAYLKNLIELFAENKNKIIASNYQKRNGVPAIFPREFFKELKLLKGDFGARDFLEKNKNATIVSSSDVCLIDLDTKSDYENYKNLIKSDATK